MIFEFYEQKYVNKCTFKIKFGAVHQTGKPLYNYIIIKVLVKCLPFHAMTIN